MRKEKIYEVKMRYTFEGVYKVKATSKSEANKITEENCGLVMGRSINTTSDQVIDWDFGMHPENEIVTTKLLV